MKRPLFTIALICFLAVSVCSFFGFKTNHPPLRAEEVILDTYAGNSPCGNFIKPMLGIPATAECERVKWYLVLYRGDEKNPGLFKLNCIYGMQEAGLPGFVGGGKTIEAEGRWQITNGAKANPDAVVYKLLSKDGQQAMRFVKINDDIIHLLYRDSSLMIGNGGWSYTLSRIKK